MKDWLLVVFASFAIAAGAAAQQSKLRMNAAIPDETQRVAADIYATIEVANTLPGPEYRIEARVEAHPVALPDIDAELARIAAKYKTAVGSTVPECTALAGATVALKQAPDEKAVAGLRDAVTAARRPAVAKGCAEEVEAADLVVGRTYRIFDTSLPIEAGHFATVSLFRINPVDGTSTPVARKVFDAGPLGGIRSNVLLGGLPNKDELWFAKQTTNPNEFIITPEEDRDDYDPLAALVLSWEPAQDTSGWTQAIAFKRGVFGGSFAIGLGTETEQPIYLVGYSLHLSRFGLAAGVAGFNQRRLKGIYKGDGTDKVSTNLTPDQLMDDTFGTGFWIGITMKP